MQPYLSLFKESFDKELAEIKQTLLTQLQGTTISGSDQPHSFEILNPQPLPEKLVVDRYVYNIDAGRIKVGVDFDQKTQKLIQIAKLGDDYHADEVITIKGKLSESILQFGKKSQEVSEVVPAILPVERPKETLVPKTKDFSKAILKGSELFKDIERKIRIFLKGTPGGGNKTLFVLEGDPGTGKGIAARNALLRECGKEIAPDKIKLMGFTTEDFKIKLEASLAIKQARDLYKRYLHNLTLNKTTDDDKLFKDTDDDIKRKALAEVQSELGKKLFGYKLTIKDMESESELDKLKDPVKMLKSLGSDEAKVPYSPSNGWMEAPSHMNNEDLFFTLYQGNAKAIFIDEGDYFLKNDNPLMKIATDNKPFRRIFYGTRKGYVEVNDNILPEEYWYSGKVIIATNLPKSQWNPAITTRANVASLYLTIEQLFSRLADIINEIKANDLPHIPAEVLQTVYRYLKMLAKEGQLTKFDFRTFVTMSDQLAMIIQDVCEEELVKNSVNKAAKFNIYKATSEKFKIWRDSEDGRKLYMNAMKQWKKSSYTQLKNMNDPKADPSGQNVIEFHG